MNANQIVTATAETTATANSAHWSFGDHTTTITRRRLTNGKVRIRITIKRLHIPSAQQAAERTEYRDLTPAAANTLFTQQVTAWNTRYLTRLALTA